MRKYIKAKDNNNIPIILQGSSVKEVRLDGRGWASLHSDTQFVISKIINLEKNYYHGYNTRLRKFYFGQGILWDTHYDRIVAIFLEGQRVAVLNNWELDYYNEFKRFKKALKDAGYNSRGDKCISFVNSFSDFIVDPLAPKFEDYSTEYQRTVSREFMELERASISIPVEEVVEETVEDDMPW